MEFNTVEEALEELRNGKIILVTDDEDRENEGDFICALEFATTENINFMAMHGKGLICMPMSEKYVKNSDFRRWYRKILIIMRQHLQFRSIMYLQQPGYLFAERSITAMKCVEDNAKPEDFRRPGHMFPSSFEEKWCT